VKLQTMMVGGRRFVERAALDRFVEAVTAAASAKLQPRCCEAETFAAAPRTAETSRQLKAEGLLSKSSRKKTSAGRRNAQYAQ
jgi:hypothetical protein